MAETDQVVILGLTKTLTDTYVDEFKLEDRDPEFLYKYDHQWLLKTSNQIQVAFADGVKSNTVEDVLEDNDDQQHELSIEKYEGNRYPPNDELKLIAHRLSVGNKKRLHGQKSAEVIVRRL